MLHKRAKIDAADDASAASFGCLVASHLVQIKSKCLRRNVELDMLKLLYGVLEEEDALSEGRLTWEES